jgi:hypothetical protein
MRRAVLVALLAVACTLTAADLAGACSCRFRTPHERVAAADVAFVGRVVEREQIAERPQQEDRTYRYILEVERVFKGRLDRRLEVRANTNGAMCGTTMEVGQRVGLLVGGEGPPYSVSSCQRISPEDLRRGTSPYPRARGRGTASLLVPGQFGSASLLAVDRRGRPLAWGMGGSGTAVSVCPGGERVVQAGDALIVRRGRDLRRLSARSLPGRAFAVRCLDRRARDVLFATYGRVGRFHGGRRTVLRRGRAFAAALGRRRSVVVTGSYGSGAAGVLDHRTRRLRPLGTGVPFAQAISPDERRVALVASRARGEPRRLVSVLQIFDLSTGRVTERVVAEGEESWGPLYWRGNRRVAFVDAENGVAHLLDTEGRRRARLRGLPRGGTAVLAGTTLWLVDGVGRLLRGALPGRMPRRVSLLPEARVGTPVAVPGGLRIRAPRRAPRLGEQPARAAARARSACRRPRR